MTETLKALYKEMADMTLPKCKGCRVPLSCCDGMYCDMAKDLALERGETLPPDTGHPTLPFMGATGCILEPYQRPSCTLHTCRINGLGFDPDDQPWTKKYFELRGRIETIENDEFEERTKGESYGADMS